MASKRRSHRGGAAADEPSKKAGRTEHPLMSALKTFGVENQQMMFSELLDHITKDAVDDLFDADPSETALKIGAQLIVQIFFWMKEMFHSYEYSFRIASISSSRTAASVHTALWLPGRCSAARSSAKYSADRYSAIPFR